METKLSTNNNIARFRPSPDIVTGALKVDPEIFLPTRGLPIQIQNIYNSQDSYNDAFGYGRTLSVNLTLVENADGSVTLRRGTGGVDTFVPSNGNYIPPLGVFNLLVKDEGAEQWIETTPDGIQFIYPLLPLGQTSKIQTVFDRNGNQIQFTYTGGLLTRITDPAGRDVNFSYTGGKLTSITDWANRITTYSYTGDDLTQEVGPSLCITTYQYYPDHKLQAITDPEGYTVSYTYDPQGRVSTKTYLGDKTTTYDYDTVNRKTTVTDPLGNATVYEYDVNGDITKITDALGNITTFTYEQRLMTSRTDPNGNLTTYNYDFTNPNIRSRSNLLSVEDADEEITSFTYNSENDLLTITDPLGNVTRFTYDSNGNLLRQVDPLGNMVTFTYDQYGQQLKGRQVIGYEQSEPSYNWINTSLSLGLTSDNQSVYHQLPFTVNFYGDDYTGVHICTNGFLSFTSDSTSPSPVPIPDPALPNALLAGLWVDLDPSLGGSITYYEDATKFVVSWVNVPLHDNPSATQTFQVIIEQNGNITFQYQSLNTVPSLAVVGIESQEGLIGIQYPTDQLANLKALLFSYSLAVTQYSYDSYGYGNLTKVTDPLSHETNFEFDAAGNVKKITDALTHTSEYTYDAQNRILSATNAMLQTTEFGYSAKGNLTTLKDANNKVTSYTYNIFDKVTRVTDANLHVTNYTYDDVGNLIQITDANNHSTQHEYDAIYRLRRVIDAISLANGYGYRRKLTVTTGAQAAQAGTSVKITLDTDTLQAAGKLRADRKDWRVVAYDRQAKVFMELDRDYLSPTETWFALQSEIAANSNSDFSGNHSYYVYYGQPLEEGQPPALLSLIYHQGAGAPSDTSGTLVRNDMDATFQDEDGFVVDVKEPNEPRFYSGHYSGTKALLLESERTNLISNSTFEGDVSGWPVTFRATRSASADRSLHRYYSMKMVPSGNDPFVGTAQGTEGIPVLSNRFYTSSGWVYVPSGNSETALLEIAWWDSSGNLIRQDQSSSATKGSWQFLYVTAFSPSNAAYASVRLRGTGTYVAGDVFYMDAVRFEQEMFFTSYIPTTNQSVSCNGEHLTYPTSGNIQASQGSISIWVKVEYPPASISLRTFFDSRSSGNNGIIIYRNGSDQLVLRIGNASNYKETVSSGTMNWAVGSWHHIAATWDSQIQQLYVDGSSVGSTLSPFLPTLFNENMYLGNGINLLAPAASYFADFSIYNIVLLGPEIIEIVNRTAPPHAIYGALFFADFDQNKDGYSRIIISPEPTVTAGSEETTGTPWWYRAARQYEYDKVGNPLKRLDANGQTIRYTYDKLNRLTKVQYPKGTDVSFGYDAISRRTLMTDATGTTTYQYDAATKVISVTFPGNKTVSYQYDMADRRVQMTNPDGEVTQYTYDLADRLTNIIDPQNLTTSYSYDAANRLTQAIGGNGVKVLYTYDNANRITKVENRKSDNTLISSFEYLLDAVGYRTRMTEANGDYTEYGYDNVYQLLSEVKKNAQGSVLYSYAYTYDNVGNRLTMTKDGQLTSYTYDANNRLLTAGSVNFGYDANGNTTSKTGPTTYQYDYENHLTKIIYPDGSKNWFEYNGDGIRQSKRDTASYVRFLYDGSDVLQEKSNITGLTSAGYLHGLLGVVKQRRNNTDSWYLFDGLLSTRTLTDSAQVVTDTYSYEAFGNVLSITGSTVNPFKYAGSWGYYTDDESDLMLLTLRYYDPSVGRFTTRDPIVENVNLYSYVGNSPVNWIDPDGIAAAAALIGAGVVVEVALPFPDPTDVIGITLIGIGAIGLAIASTIAKVSTDTGKCEPPETCDSPIYRNFPKCTDLSERNLDFREKRRLERWARKRWKRFRFEKNGDPSFKKPGDLHTKIMVGGYSPASFITKQCCEDMPGGPKLRYYYHVA